MKTRKLVTGILMTTALMASGTALACDSMGPATHMGQLMSVDASKHTFTIQDAQSRSPITFVATEEIISGLKGFAGSLMVNYEKSAEGSLNAVGVTF